MLKTIHINTVPFQACKSTVFTLHTTITTIGMYMYLYSELHKSSLLHNASLQDGLKDTSRYHRLLGLQEFQVPRSASHPLKTPLPNCQNALLVLSDLQNIMNEDVHVCAWRRSVLAKKATLSGNAMIQLSLIGQRVIRPQLYCR